MNDTEPQTAGGKVLFHFAMSLDGFVAGPGHEMDWMTGTARPGLQLGQGIRLDDNPGSEPINLHHIGRSDPTATINVRYRPTTTAKIPTRTGAGQLTGHTPSPKHGWTVREEPR